MRKTAALFALLVLAACGTPQEQCINRATRETRTLQSLLAETEGNLARGYAWEEYEVPTTRWEVCGYDTYTRRDGRVIQKPRMCLEDDTITRRRQVVIDPVTETRKRDNLRAKIRALAPQMNAEIAACRAAYPEEPK